MPIEQQIAVFRRYAAALLAVLALSFASCAYYNTFFYAEKYYKQAERARKDRVDDAPTALEIGHYEKCIKQCSKLIAEYPDSKYVDDALFLMATSYYYWGRYDDAMKWYGQIEENYPQSESIREVRFMTASCHLELREYVEAENVLRELLGSAGAEDSERIMFALSEVAASRGEMKEAVRHLRSLLRGGASDRLKLDAHLALGDAYFTMGAYDSAAMSYEEVARGSGKKEERVEARKRMGQAWQARGDYRRALDIYSQLLLTVEESPAKAGQKDQQRGALLLRMGECHNDLQEHDKALELFGLVMEDFPKSSMAAEAEFLMGYTYEVYFDDIDRAKISYDRVPSHFQKSVFVDEAARRSEGLGKLKQYREQGGVTEQAEGEGAFLSAELNLFQLNKPDKALEIYREVESTYPESPLAPKAAYAAAWVLVHKLDRVDEGMEEYRRIVKQYPFSPYAEGARRILGIESLTFSLHGPPLPKGWTPPDSTALAALRKAGWPGSSDTTLVPADSAAVRTAAPVGGRPDSTAAPAPAGLGGAAAGHVGNAGGSAPPDTTGSSAPPDSSQSGATPSDTTGAGAPNGGEENNP